jgi:hypothetical protein
MAKDKHEAKVITLRSTPTIDPTRSGSLLREPSKEVAIRSKEHRHEARVRLFAEPGATGVLEFTTFEGRLYRSYVPAAKAEKKFDKLVEALQTLSKYKPALP